MSSSNDTKLEWLDHKWLKLAWIFNLARGLEATDRPFDLPKDFATVFRDIKAAIDRQDIDSSPGSGRPANLDTKIRVVDLEKFLSSLKYVPERLRSAVSALTDLQSEWAQVQGIELPQLGALPKQGRPSLRPEIEAAFNRLKEEDKIDTAARTSQLIEPVRERVRVMMKQPDLEGGLGDQVIRVVINAQRRANP